jgi:hypothetical protein
VRLRSKQLPAFRTSFPCGHLHSLQTLQTAVGDPWLSITLTLWHILHTVSHWPVSATLSTLQTAASQQTVDHIVCQQVGWQLTAHTQSATDRWLPFLHFVTHIAVINHWLVLDLPIGWPLVRTVGGRCALQALWSFKLSSPRDASSHSITTLQLARWEAW